jgi:6-carboxyhexanoate--CoA ligase
MKNLLSIRMRASKQVKSQKSKVRTRKSQIQSAPGGQASKNTEVHISGAEGLYEKLEIEKVVTRYIERALHHPKGKADKIIITIEDIKQKPKEISILPVATVRCDSPAEAKKIVPLLLQSLGISKRSINSAFQLIKKGEMRGAALITATSGNRLEPDMKRGVRVSRLGIDTAALKVLSRRLKQLGINTDTVKEALIIASKVMSSRQVIAELCMSDDPDYTTGYVASKNFGYLRIPHIKPPGSRSGGRAFFVHEKMQVNKIITYLEHIPVLVTKSAPCRGIISTDEILSGSYK